MSDQIKLEVVLGSQWGDEGKGKIVDILASKSDVVCRCQGGNNAGHTVIVGDAAYDFHLIPSGLVCPGTMNVLGNGLVIHLPGLFSELKSCEAKGLTDWKDRLLISNRSHLVFDVHQTVDGLEEERRAAGGKKLGTTKKGIGPAYSSKAARRNLRVCDLLGNFDEFSVKFRALGQYFQTAFPSGDFNIEGELKYLDGIRSQLRPLVCDTIQYMNKAFSSGKRILVEGANACMLDIDFGTYPYVTSSNCSIGGVCTGLGLPPQSIGTVIGVVKAYTTRVGAGILPTELENETGERLQRVGKEFGVTTGRKRRCGWLDLVVVKYTAMINGYTSLAITKLDILDDFEEVKVGVEYLRNGQILTDYPSCDAEFEGIEVRYVTLPGWKKEQYAKECSSLADLPENAQKYLDVVSEIVGVPIQFVGIGPERHATVQVY